MWLYRIKYCHLFKRKIKNIKFIVHNFYRKGSIENKKRLLKNINVIKCDIRNQKDLQKIPKFDF